MRLIELSKKSDLIVLILSFVIISHIANYTSVKAHEETHKAITKNFGCLNSTIEVSFLKLSGSHRCNEYSNQTYEMMLKERELQSINEIITYNLAGIGSKIVLSTYFIFLALTILLMENNEPKKTD